MKLIDKSAVLAEIDKVMAEEMKFYETACKEGDEEVSSSPMVYTRLQILRSYIDTLEVKEVDLEEASKNYALNNTPWDDCKDEIQESFKAGANWQKEQFEKNRIAACDRQTGEEAEREQDFVMGIIECEHRQPTFDDAIKYGMRLQRENMMKDATDVTVHIEAGNYPYIPQLELYDYDKDIPLAKEGDKYKVILIKED